MVMVDLFGQIVAPGYIIAVLSNFVFGKVLSDSNGELRPYLVSQTYLIVIQAILFIIGITAPRAGESRPSWYNKSAPTALYWILNFVLCVFPSVIICINIVGIV